MPRNAETGRPSAFARGFGRLVDAIAKGDVYDAQTGQYRNVGRGLIGRAAQIGSTLYGGPVVGQIVGQGAENWVNTGNPLNFTGNTSRLGGLVNALIGDRGNAGLAGPQRQRFPVDTSLVVPNVGNVMIGGVSQPEQTGDPLAQQIANREEQIAAQLSAALAAAASSRRREGPTGQQRFGSGLTGSWNTYGGQSVGQFDPRKIGKVSGHAYGDMGEGRMGGGGGGFSQEAFLNWKASKTN